MYNLRADTLTFTLPDCWPEVSLSQFIALSEPDAPTDTAFVINTLTGLTDFDFHALKAYDLDEVITAELAFLKTPPDIPTLPQFITVAGKTIKLPTDLGAYATLGQMRDVDFVIRQRQSQDLPVDVVALAPTLLTVYLWPLLTNEPYKDRQHSETLFKTLGNLPCPEGLSVAAFFLSSFLHPTPSGKISIKKVLPTPLKSWQRAAHRYFPRLATTLPLFN